MTDNPMTVGEFMMKLQEFDPSHRIVFRGNHADSNFHLDIIKGFEVENGCIYYKNSPKPLEEYTAVIIKIA